MNHVARARDERNGELPLEDEPKTYAPEPMCRPEPQEFDWDGGDTIIEAQPRTAVYVNPLNAVVIRQDQSWDCYAERDAIVIVTRPSLPALIKRLQEIAGEP